MKKIFLILVFAMVTIISVDAHSNRHPHISITFQSFYDELSPYGDWIYMPDYGYVWRPFFDRPDAFRPYSSGGDWVYTEYGWTWVSDYSWGWAPFHYGRWQFDDYLGWMWLPGYDWAPAWVTWGSYGNYWGWAPLGPSINVSMNFDWRAPDIWWTFIPTRHFRSHHWRSHIYDRHVHVTNITYINNIYINDNDRDHQSWFRGPRVNDVERHTRSKVRQMEVVRSDRAGDARVSNDRVTIYQPRVERGGDNYRPTQSRNAENVRGTYRVEQKNPRSNDPGMNRRGDDRNSGRQEEIRRENTERRNQQGVQPSERSREKQGAVRGTETPRNERKKENNVNPGKRTETQNSSANNNVRSTTGKQETRSTQGVGQQNREQKQNVGAGTRSGNKSDVNPSKNRTEKKTETKSKENSDRKSNSDRSRR
jgi:hypothetical protein